MKNKYKSVVAVLLILLTIGIVVGNWHMQINGKMSMFDGCSVQWSLFLISFCFVWLNINVHEKNKKGDLDTEVSYSNRYINLTTLFNVLAPITVSIGLTYIDYTATPNLLLLPALTGMVIVICYHLYYALAKNVYVWSPVCISYIAYYITGRVEFDNGSFEVYSLLAGTGIYFGAVILDYIGMHILNNRKWYICVDNEASHNLFLKWFLPMARTQAKRDILAIKKDIIKIGLLFLSIICIVIWLFRDDYDGAFITTIFGMIVALIIMIMMFREYYVLNKKVFDRCKMPSHNNYMVFMPMCLIIVIFLFENVLSYFMWQSGIGQGLALVFLGACMVLCFVLLYNLRIFIWCPISLYAALFGALVFTEAGMLGYVARCLVIGLIGSIEYGLTLILNTDNERSKLFK